MVKALENMVTGEQVVAWLIICFLVAYFVYKEWPEFKKRVMGIGKTEEKQEDIESRVTALEEGFKDLHKKLDNDYQEIREIKEEIRDQRRISEESLEEREIIMKALLSCLEGLQEIGANGSTKQAQKDIHDYLNKVAHDSRRKEE